MSESKENPVVADKECNNSGSIADTKLPDDRYSKFFNEYLTVLEEVSMAGESADNLILV